MGVSVGGCVAVCVAANVGKDVWVGVSEGIGIGETGVFPAQAGRKGVKSNIIKKACFMETQLYLQAV